VALLSAVHRAKGTAGASVGRHLKRLHVKASPETAGLVGPALDDVLAAARVQSHVLDTDPALEAGAFEVIGLELGEAPE
jgi:hypothetical protein